MNIPNSITTIQTKEKQAISSSEGFNLINSVLPGVVGRLSTNNLTKTLSIYQSTGKFQPELSLRVARAGLVGMSLQTMSNFGIREAIISKNDTGPTLLAKSFLAGSFGGLFMHPVSVRFFLGDKLPNFPSSLSPAFSQTIYILKNNPFLLKRGLLTRTLMSGTDWSIFFLTKKVMHQQLNFDSETSSLAASILSNLVGALFMEKYVLEIKQEPTAFLSNQAAKSTTQSSRSAVVKAAFFALLVSERFIQDKVNDLVKNN